MKQIIDNLFVRNDECNKQNIELEKYASLLNKKIPIKNVFNWKKRIFLNLYNLKFESFFISYCFKAFRQWIISNQTYEIWFVNDCNKLLDFLNLREKLNTNELNYLNKINSITFSKIRNIKKLMIDFVLYPNEEIWYIYNILILQKKVNDSFVNVCKSANVLLTNKRLMIVRENELILSLEYTETMMVTVHELGIRISNNFLEYKLFTNEQYEIYVSLERIGKLLKKYL